MLRSNSDSSIALVRKEKKERLRTNINLLRDIRGRGGAFLIQGPIQGPGALSVPQHLPIWWGSVVFGLLEQAECPVGVASSLEPFPWRPRQGQARGGTEKSL